MFNDLIPAESSTAPAGGMFDDLLPGDSKPSDGGFMASAKQSAGSLIKGAGQFAGDFIPGVAQDNQVKRYGEEIIDANPTSVHSLSDIADKPATAAKEAVGNAASSMAGIVGARLIGQGITAAAPLTGPAAPIVAGVGQGISLLGPYAVAALPSFGGIREQQGPDDSVGAKAAAAAGAAAVGVIENKFGPQEWALSALTKGGREKLAEQFLSKTLTGSIAKGMATGAAVEGAEELVQNPIEQLAGFQDPMTAKNLEDTVFSGAMGAIGGGIVGGPMAGLSHRQPAVVPRADGQGDVAIDPTVGPLSAAAADHVHRTDADAAQAATGDLFGDLTGPLVGAPENTGDPFAEPAVADEPISPLLSWQQETDPVSLEEAQAIVQQSREAGYDGHAVIRHGAGFTTVPKDWLNADQVKAAAAYQPQSAAVDLFSDLPSSIDQAASQANTTPSEAQITAGNYQKGHIKVGPLNIAIENPVGSTRTGPGWKTKMSAHYGYIKRTEGADGDQVDVYVRQGTPTDFAGPVFVVDQYDPATGKFDEHKAMIGYRFQGQALKAYDAHFGDGTGPSRRKGITRMSAAEFKVWATKGDTQIPVVTPAEVTKAAPAKVENYGEHIGGSRADRWRLRGLSVEDLAEMSATEAAGYVTKDAVWPKPDYAKLISDGMAPHAAALLKQIRDRMTIAPRKDTEGGRRDYVEAVSLIREAAKSITTEDDVKALAGKINQALAIPDSLGLVEREKPEIKAALNKLWSIYKGRSSPLTVSWSDQRKAKQMLAEGWPATKKQIVKAERDNRELPSRPHLDNLKRTAPDVRNGKDITPQQLAEFFGFRGIEFGNWAANDERQKSINLAYEALHDLAGVLNVPPRALSLNGTLGLAFGARGGGRHAAHYEPGKLVVNLTKLNGAGSLAHEFGHALDHYLGELDRSDAYGGKARGASGWMNSRRDLKNLRPELAAAFEKVMTALFNRDRTQAEAVRDAELEVERRQADLDRADKHLAKEGLSGKERKEWDSWRNATQLKLSGAQKRLAELRDQPKPAGGYGNVQSSFYAQAKALSGKSENGYWTRPTEMFARAFESFVFDQLEASDYLVHGVESDRYGDTDRFKGNPYPTGAEREAINQAFGELVNTLKVRNGAQIYSAARPGVKTSAMDGAIFESAKAGSTLSSILEAMAEASPTPFYRELAQLLLEKKVDARLQTAPDDGLHGGAYDPRTNTIALLTAQDAERHLMHEAVHAATLAALQTKNLASGQMKALYEHAKAQLTGSHYGLQNVEEFVSEALSNPDLQAELADLPAKPGLNLATAWHWFVRNVRQLLGLDKRNESLLQQVLATSVDLMTPTAPNGKPSNLSPQQWRQVRTPEFKAWFGDWERASLRDFLNGQPVVELTGNEAPRNAGFAAIRNWATEIFESAPYNGKATNQELGEVIMDHRSVRDSMGHKMTPSKANAFAAVPRVIEQGRVVHIESRNARTDSFYITAPVRIAGVDDLVTVLVHRDPNSQRMYLHSVTTKENLLSSRVSGADAKASERSGSSYEGGVRSVLHDLLTFKGRSSAVVDENGEPRVVYHGSRQAGAIQAFKPNERGLIWAASQYKTAESYGGGILPVFLNIRNPAEVDLGGKNYVELPVTNGEDFTDHFGMQAKRDGHDGAILRNLVDDGGELTVPIEIAGDDFVVFDPAQIKHATENRGTFDAGNPDIRYNKADEPDRLTVSEWVGHQLANQRGWALGALTRDQLADIYGKEMPEVAQFDRVVQEMDQARNVIAEKADEVIERWRKLPAKVADTLAEVMHTATVEQFDPDLKTREEVATPEQSILLKDWASLPEEAKQLYRDVRDTYTATLRKLRNGLTKRAERAGRAGQRTAAEIRLQFDKYLEEGPYFPLARFGDFVLIANNRMKERIVESFESSAAREKRARQLRVKGWTTKLTAKKDFNAASDGPSGEFVGKVLKLVDGLELDAKEKGALMDDLNQLAIGALPDQSYRRHFAHRKGTPGFSSDAMRAFASNMQHVAHHVARTLHGDELTLLLDNMNKGIREATGDVDTTVQQQVSNELAKRMELMLRPDTHPVTALAGQVGFVMSLGGSVASGLTNLSQTPLITFPWLGAKFGFDKAAGALTQASKDYFGGRWDQWSGFVLKDNKALSPEEKRALQQLEDAGLINLTQTSDLASTATTDSASSSRSWAINRAMKIVGWTFSVPEVFNRQVSALAAYRLATEKGQTHDQAVETALETLRRTHFDYSASNRSRWMAGNFTRVVTMFKQYSQQMTYLLWRNAHQALKAESAEVRREARRMLLGVAAMHFAAAGTLGLPLGVFGITPLLGLLSIGMGDGDDPWDWQVEFRNMLADVFGKAGGEAIAHGPMRMLLNVDFASRVGLGDLWIRSPRGEQEGRDLVEAWMLTLLGPVAGYIGNMGTAAKAFEEGKVGRGLEAMLPKMMAAPLKAARYESEGVKSWRGDDLGVALDAGDILGTALGFNPTKIAEMHEGQAAIKGREQKLMGRRQEIVNQWIAAVLAGDQAMVVESMQEAMRFSQANPSMAIKADSLHRSLQTKLRNQALIKDGVYLSKRRQDLRAEGRFANVTE